jgi:Synergist-CTERM protein sorting domain-containing protein
MARQKSMFIFLLLFLFTSLFPASALDAGQVPEMVEDRDEVRWEMDGNNPATSSARSDGSRPEGVFFLWKYRSASALNSTLSTGWWAVWDCFVSDPEQVLRSVTIEGPMYRESLFYQEEEGYNWSPRTFPSLAQNVEDLRALAEAWQTPGRLEYTFNFTPKSGEPWTQTVSIDLTKLDENEVNACLGAFSVKRDGVELFREGRNSSFQVLSPESGRNIFTVEWRNPFDNPSAPGWKPYRARGRVVFPEYHTPNIPGRLQRNFNDYAGAPLQIDLDNLLDRLGEEADWREMFIRDGAVQVHYRRPDLPNVVLASTLQLLPDVMAAPEAIISKIYKRAGADTFQEPVFSKTARIGVAAYKTQDPAWETADVRFFLDGAPMENVNHENFNRNDMMVRNRIFGWTESAALSGEKELAVELLYRNGQSRRVARKLSFDSDVSRFPDDPQFTMLEGENEVVLKPDVPFDGTVNVFAVGYPEDLLTDGASAGMELVTDSLSRVGSTLRNWIQPVEGDFYTRFNLLDMANGAIGRGAAWKKAFAVFRFNYTGAVSYDVRYELRASGGEASSLRPNISLSYRRFVPARGGVSYSVMIDDIWLDTVSAGLVDSVKAYGPGLPDEGEHLLRWDMGMGMGLYDSPSWNPEVFWTDVAPGNMLEYTLVARKKDGSSHEETFQIDLRNLREAESILRQSAGAVSVTRQGRELSIGEQARNGEYLQVLSPDSAKNLFLVNPAAGETDVNRVVLRLNTSVAYGVLEHADGTNSQRLERVLNVAPGTLNPVSVNPAQLSLRGRTQPVDWREWFLRNGDLRVWLTPLCSVPVSSAIGGEYMSPVSIRNDLEILPDVMLRNTAEYRSILHPDSTGTAFTSPVEELQVYLNGTVLPQEGGGQMPSLLARFAGQDLLTSPNKPNQMGSLAVEGTGVYFEGHFDNPSQFDGSRKLEVAVTYPDGSKRTIRRSFEMKLDHSMYPHNATLSYKSGSNAYAPVTQPALWTGNESFRWVWEKLDGRAVIQTAVQSGGIRNNAWSSWGYRAFSGHGPLAAELTGIPEDFYRVHPRLTHVYMGNIHYQKGYNILPVPAKLKVTLTGTVPQGAEWSVDGGAAWHASGETLSLNPGTYTVIFRSIAGWDEPQSISVVLPKGGTVEKSARYEVWTGSLTVTLNPQAGAQWSVDAGTTWRSSGEALVLQAGPSRTYRIVLREPAGYYPAEARSVSLTSRNQSEHVLVNFRRIPVIPPEDKISDDPNDNSGVLPVTNEDVNNINDGIGEGEIDTGDATGDLEPYTPGTGEIVPETVDREKSKESLENDFGSRAEPEILKAKSFVIEAEGDTSGKFVPVHVEFKVTYEELDSIDEAIRDRINDEISSGKTLTEAFLRNVRIYKVIPLVEGERVVDLARMVLEREDLEEKLSRFFVVEEKDGTYSAAFDILIMDGLPNDLRNLIQPLYTESDDLGRFMIFDGKEDGKFTDPMLLAAPKPKEDQGGGGSSGGGCSSIGFSPFSLLLILPLFLLKK